MVVTRLDPLLCRLAQVQAANVVLEGAPPTSCHAHFLLLVPAPPRGDARHVEVVGRVAGVDDAGWAWRCQGGVLPQGIALFPVDAAVIKQRQHNSVLCLITGVRVLM